MADDNTEQLVASLDVSIVKLTKTLQKALGETDSFTKSNEGKHKASLERVERMYEQLDLSNKLQVASTAGDQARVKALQEELELSRQIQRYRSAGLNSSDATAAARAHMSAMAIAEQAASGGLNRAQAMELTHVAKSLFDQIAAGASPLRALQVEGGRIAQVFSEGEGGVGGTFKALTSMLTPMTLGIGGAVAAFAALAIVAAKAHDAAEEVVSLKVDADKLGMPIEQLQLWQFIAAQTHVSNQQLDQSFEGLTATLGKLKSGIREQRVQPFIEELGISDADIAKANNAADLMELIISKMSKIKDAGERTQIADAFGMQAALPLLGRTRAEIEGMTDDFARNAAVVSGQAATALDHQNEQMERAHALMHDKIRADLVALSPLVNDLALAWDHVAEAALGALADMVKAGSFKPGALPSAPQTPTQTAGVGLHMVGNVIGGPFGGMLADYVTRVLDHVGTPDAGHAPTRIPHGQPEQGAGVGARMVEAKKATDDLSKAMAEYVTHTSHAYEMQQRIAKDRAAGGTVTPQQEAQLMASARAQDAKYGAAAAKRAESAANKAVDVLKASDDAIDAAKKDELKARISLTGDLMADHQLKLQELAADRDRKNRQATQDAQTGKISASARDSVIGSNNQAYGEGVDLETRRFAQETADQARTYADDLRRYQIAHLTASAALATSTQAWADDTRQAYQLQAKSSRSDFMAATNKRLTEAGANHLTAEQAQAEIAAYDARAAEELSRSNREVNTQVAARKREFADQLQGYLLTTLEAEAASAETATQRRAIEQRILAIRQSQQRDELERQIKAPGFQGDAGAARSGLATAQAAEQSQFDDEHLSPWDAWTREGQKASADVGSAMQTGAVRGIDQLNSGLAQAMANGRSMGDVFKSVFREMETDALQYLLRQAEVGAFGAGGLNLGGMLSSGFGLFGGGGGGLPGVVPGTAEVFKALDAMALPAFAGGTDDTPGGPTLYDEKGVEGYVPPGAQIIPNSTLKGLAKISDAVASGGLSGGQDVQMNHHFSIDLTGANGDEAIANAVTTAVAHGVSLAVGQSRADLRKAQTSSRRSFV